MQFAGPCHPSGTFSTAETCAAKQTIIVGTGYHLLSNTILFSLSIELPLICMDTSREKSQFCFPSSGTGPNWNQTSFGMPEASNGGQKRIKHDYSTNSWTSQISQEIVGNMVYTPKSFANRWTSSALPRERSYRTSVRLLEPSP